MSTVQTTVKESRHILWITAILLALLSGNAMMALEMIYDLPRSKALAGLDEIEMVWVIWQLTWPMTTGLALCVAVYLASSDRDSYWVKALLIMAIFLALGAFTTQDLAYQLQDIQLVGSRNPKVWLGWIGVVYFSLYGFQLFLLAVVTSFGLGAVISRVAVKYVDESGNSRIGFLGKAFWFLVFVGLVGAGILYVSQMDSDNYSGSYTPPSTPPSSFTSPPPNNNDEEKRTESVRQITAEARREGILSRNRFYGYDGYYEMELINECTGTIKVAVNYLSLDNETWITEGWWSISAGNSRSIHPGGIYTTNGVIYVYAYEGSFQNPDTRWVGDEDDGIHKYVVDDDFVALSEDPIKISSRKRVLFHKWDLESTSVKNTFTFNC